jgi:rare lipoprotein A
LLLVVLVPACAPGRVSEPSAPQPPGEFHEEGVASWYGPGFDGRTTASGETFDADALTAAHRRLPFDSRVRVVNLDNGLEVVVRINDRGPYVDGRIIDVSQAAAHALGMIETGIARVRLFLESG